MLFFAILLGIVCYAAAGYLLWERRTFIYLFALLGGHLSALANPLWRALYGITVSPDLAAFQALLGQREPLSALLAAGWHYPLPALIVLYLRRERWWFPGIISGGLTYLIFVLYHLLIEAIGLRNNVWAYSETALAFGLPPVLLAGLMAGLISYILLFLIINILHYAPISMFATVFPAVLAISLLVFGLLGAPFWITRLLAAADWASSIGLASTLLLIVWAVQIVTVGIHRSA
jgi:hypothetical protein